MNTKVKTKTQMLGKVLVFAITLLIAGTTNAQQIKIAVMELRAGSNVNQSEIEGLSGMLSTALDNTGRFILVERNQIDKVIKEQGFQKSSLTNAQVAKVGNVLGVNKILIGDVTKVFGEYNVDIRIIDASSGQVLAPVGKTLKGQEYRIYIQQLVDDLTQKLVNSGTFVRKPQNSYTSMTELLSAATYILRNFQKINETEFTVFFTPSKQYAQKFFEDEDYLAILHNDYSERLPYELSQIPISLQNISLFPLNVNDLSETKDEMTIHRDAYGISNTNCYLSIIYIVYQGKYYLVRLYKIKCK